MPAETDVGNDRVPQEPYTLRDKLIGIAGVAAIVLAFSLWVRGAASEPRPASGPSPLVLLEPRSGALVSGPVPVVFQTPAELAPGPGGWSDGPHHLHLVVDGRDHMPRPGDIARVGPGCFRWTLAGLPPGEYEIRLAWSGLDHRLLPEGRSEAATVRVAP